MGQTKELSQMFKQMGEDYLTDIDMLGNLHNEPREYWVDIPNYENYEISNFSKIRNKSKGNILNQWKSQSGYLQCTLSKENKKKNFPIHQLIAICFLNHKPCGMKIVVDHINNNKLDNRIENLQLITQRENCSKNRKINTSKYIGVSFEKHTNKYVSQIQISGKDIRIGSFETEIEAYNAYQKKLHEHNSNEYQKLNKQRLEVTVTNFGKFYKAKLNGVSINREKLYNILGIESTAGMRLEYHLFEFEKHDQKYIIDFNEISVS